MNENGREWMGIGGTSWKRKENRLEWEKRKSNNVVLS
jgi:hypothetical protein